MALVTVFVLDVGASMADDNKLEVGSTLLLSPASKHSFTAIENCILGEQHDDSISPQVSLLNIPTFTGNWFLTEIPLFIFSGNAFQ